MNQKTLIIGMGVCLCLIILPAPGHGFQLGFSFGDPTMVLIAPVSNVRVGIGDINDQQLLVNVDFEFHESIFADEVSAYVAFGVQLAPGGDDLNLGVRLPVGLRFHLTPRWHLFAEIAPAVYLVPGSSFDWQWGVGILVDL